jgi:hypothetical protein
MINDERREITVESLSTTDRPPISSEAAIDAGLPVSATARTLIVDFRSGESVQCHPEIQPFLQDGWHLQKAVPKLVDGRIRLLAVIERRQKLFT